MFIIAWRESCLCHLYIKLRYYLLEEENEDLNQDINLKDNTNSYNLNSLIKKNIEVSINCSLCQTNFSKKDYLKRHIEAVHERKPHKSARHVITKE